LGWNTGGGHFGHGGAFATSMSINSNSGLITVFMVQQAGNSEDVEKAIGAVNKVVEERFGSPRKKPSE
jgi:hypothetical protein